MPIPQFSPLAVPPLMCPECGKPMVVEIDRHLGNKVRAVFATCDTCQYSKEIQPTYVNAADARYRTPEMRDQAKAKLQEQAKQLAEKQEADRRKSAAAAKKPGVTSGTV